MVQRLRTNQSSTEKYSRILTEAGSDFAHVVKTTCYLQNMADFTAFNEVYAEYFSAEYPARTTIEISKLPMDVLVEIEIIAEVVA